MFFKSYKKNKVCIEEPSIVCSICLETIMCDKITTNCGHYFHKQCIDASLKITSKCPMCRTKIVNKPRFRVNKKIQKMKKKLYKTIDYFSENHILLCITVGIPIMYACLVFCILLYIFEKTIYSFDNEVYPEIDIDV
jgi:hypothetical protein